MRPPPPRFFRRVSVAPGGGVLIEPKGQATSGDQCPIVVWPVAYSVPKVHSADVIPHADTRSGQNQSDTAARFMQQRGSWGEEAAGLLVFGVRPTLCDLAWYTE